MGLFKSDMTEKGSLTLKRLENKTFKEVCFHNTWQKKEMKKHSNNNNKAF